MTVKSSQEIGRVIANGSPEAFLAQFAWLTDFENSPLRLMGKYDLLPNDALIIAICQERGVKQLASFDPDYAPACIGEGIQLIQTLQDWEVVQTP